MSLLSTPSPLLTMKTHASAPAKKSYIPTMAAAEPTDQFAPRPFAKPDVATNESSLQAQSTENFAQLIDIPLLSPQQQAASGIPPVQAKPTTGKLTDKSEPDKKALQAKRELQREVMVEEETEEEALAERSLTLQREAMPEDEALAERSPALQRKAMPKGEAKTLQAKPQLQRQAIAAKDNRETVQ